MLENLTVVHSHDQAEFNNRVFEDIKINVAEGEKQILHFWEKRLVLAELSTNVTISKTSAYDPAMTAVMMAEFVDDGKIRRYLVKDALKTEVFGIAQS